MAITWTCKCGHRTLLHIEWCAPCGSAKPPPEPEKPSTRPSIKDDLKK